MSILEFIYLLVELLEPGFFKNMNNIISKQI